jgi:Ran GTPase-activating protein (RanGAP) involved in mRNA processing and transport
MLSKIELESIKSCNKGEFWFTFQQLTSLDALKIAQNLPLNSIVTHLNLNGNHIGDKGAISISCIISETPSLAHLNLSGNDIGDIGAQALAKALIGNRTVRSLCLLGNCITDAGANSLANMLASNKYLQKLYLYNNKIGDEGAIAIARAASRHGQLEALWLDHNLISFEGGQKIVRLMIQSRSLTNFELTIKNEMLLKPDREAIQRMCKKNMQRSTIKTVASQTVLELSRKLILVGTLPVEVLQHVLMLAAGDQVFSSLEKVHLGSCLLDRSLIGKIIPKDVRTKNFKDLKVARYSGQELARSCATLVERY